MRFATYVLFQKQIHVTTWFWKTLLILKLFFEINLV